MDLGESYMQYLGALLIHYDLPIVGYTVNYDHFFHTPILKSSYYSQKTSEELLSCSNETWTDHNIIYHPA